MNQANESEFKSKSGLRRVLNATRYSLDGLRTARQVEHAFRQELMLAIVLTPIALLLPVGALEKLLLIGSMVLVLVAELLNSAIEAAIDHISLERHPLAKRAKDYGSAAVMLALALSGTCWAVVLYQWLAR
jgi:diacylglycerol kinase (ATP)